MTNIERKWFISLLSSEIAKVNIRTLLFCSEIRRKYNKNINFIKHILFTNEETTRSPDLNPLDFAFTWRIYCKNQKWKYFKKKNVTECENIKNNSR